LKNLWIYLGKFATRIFIACINLGYQPETVAERKARYG
jgi:hypothetical protein